MSRARQDKNLFSFTGATPPGVYRIKPPVPGQYVVVPPEFGGFQGVFWPREISDVVKFSGAVGVTVICETRLHGGREDCVDVNNRSRGCAVICERGMMPHGKQVLTWKGESRGFRLEGEVLGHGTVTDFDCGNWSDQSNEPAEDLELAVTSLVGRLSARKLNARGIHWRPGAPIKRSWIWLPDWAGPWFVRVYGLLKKVGVN